MIPNLSCFFRPELKIRIRINIGSWIRIRIRVKKLDPDQKLKKLTKKIKPWRP